MWEVGLRLDFSCLYWDTVWTELYVFSRTISQVLFIA